MLHALASEGKQRQRGRNSPANPERARLPTPIASLQSAYGNQTLLRWMVQRKCACGGSGGQCAECEKKEKDTGLMRKGAGAGVSGVPPIVHEVLRSPGQPMDAPTRALMEPRFGYDFGRVRVHTDDKAAESARAVNALAYTVGRDVVFNTGTYAPRTSSGQRLLAHELTHVVQQSSSALISGPLAMGASDSAAERQADTAANVVMKCGVVATLGAQPELIARQSVPAASAPIDGAMHDGGSPRPSSAVGCIPAAGITSGTCEAYLENAWWLPIAYANNATCACVSMPNVPTAKCVRMFLQDRLAAAPTWFKVAAALQKPLELSHPMMYEAFVQSVLTPWIYKDHVDAYRSCCCPAGPATYEKWMAVTAFPIQPCSLVGWFINRFGSCTGTPGSW